MSKLKPQIIWRSISWRFHTVLYLLYYIVLYCTISYCIVLYLLYCISKASCTCCSILECGASRQYMPSCYYYRDHTWFFFHALTSAGSRGSCLNTRPMGRVFKDLPRNLAGVDAMKQTRVIVILAYLPFSNPICSENAAKTLS